MLKDFVKNNKELRERFGNKNNRKIFFSFILLFLNRFTSKDRVSNQILYLLKIISKNSVQLRKSICYFDKL